MLYKDIKKQDIDTLDVMMRGRALDICRSAVKWFGKDNQQKQAVEEMAELTVALNHLRRGKCKKEDVCSEIADVLIMANQLAEIYGRQNVDYHIEQKLERLRKKCYDMAWQYHDQLAVKYNGKNIYERKEAV